MLGDSTYYYFESQANCVSSGYSINYPVEKNSWRKHTAKCIKTAMEAFNPGDTVRYEDENG